MTPNTMTNVLPWVILLAAVLYLLLCAWIKKIYPSSNVLWLAAACLTASICGVIYGRAFLIAFLMDAIVLAVLLIDQVTLLSRMDIRATRTMQKTASIRKPHIAQISLMNYSSRTHFAHVKDDAHQDLNASPDQHEMYLPARRTIELEYAMRPSKRGIFRFENIYVRRFSWLRFWSQFRHIPVPGDLNVYPDMQQLAEYAVLARTNRLSLIGMRKTRRVGQDNNFERLRDYNEDDNFKHIDWRSSARRNKLTVRQFQTDQSQRVMFLLDCGRMMTNEDGRLTMVDHALNAILMLSYVALSQGDSVGMMAFSDRVHSYVPIRGGKAQMNRLIHAGFDRFPEFVPTRFDKAFLHFTNNCRRRSMVFLITNVIDDVSAIEVTNYLNSLTRTHLPVLALLRDTRIFDYADNPNEDEVVLYRSAAASQVILWRSDLIRKIQHSGVLAVDAFPNDLTSPLVNQYLEAKAKHLL
jgi:uncharacterized protein (DUF58 family)